MVIDEKRTIMSIMVIETFSELFQCHHDPARFTSGVPFNPCHEENTAASVTVEVGRSVGGTG